MRKSNPCLNAGGLPLSLATAVLLSSSTTGLSRVYQKGDLDAA